MNNGNYCEWCEGYGDVQLYIDADDNAVDLCESCYALSLTTPAECSLDNDGYCRTHTGWPKP